MSRTVLGQCLQFEGKASRFRKNLARLGVSSLLVALLGLGVAACTEQAAAADVPAASLVPAALHDRGTLNVALVADYPPYGYTGADKKPAGLDVDILTAVAEHLKLTPKFTSIDFDTIVPSIVNGRFDIGAGGMGDFKSREAVVDIVDSYITVDGLLVWKGNPLHLSETSSLCGLSMAEPSGGIEITLIGDLSKTCVSQGKAKIPLQVYDDIPAALMAIETHRVQVAPYDIASAVYLARNNYPGLDAVTGTLPGSTSLDGYAVAKSNPGLSKAVAAAVDEMIASGEYGRILGKWGIAENGVKSATISAATN